MSARILSTIHGPYSGTVYGCVLAEVLARAGADRIFVWGWL